MLWTLHLEFRHLKCKVNVGNGKVFKTQPLWFSPQCWSEENIVFTLLWKLLILNVVSAVTTKTGKRDLTWVRNTVTEILCWIGGHWLWYLILNIIPLMSHQQLLHYTSLTAHVKIELMTQRNVKHTEFLKASNYQIFCYV